MRKTTLLNQPRWRLHRLLRLSLFLCLSLFGGAAYAQMQVSGKVSDEAGTGLPGVNVLAKGTANGTTTDSNGDYSISLAEGQGILIFSYIGYATQEVAVNNRSTISISLVPSIEALSEVIVVGYGTQKKSDVTGALVRVDEKSLREVPIPTLSLALQGRAAGVEIQRTSSRPGAGMQIRIRGNRSLASMNDPNNIPTNNDPLFVVDGIPFSGNINDINPNDIVSLDILKDASATAIYGSRGSNGVVLVTTKRGKAGKPQLTYDGYYGTNSVIGKYDLYDGPEFDAMRTVSRLPRKVGPPLVAGSSYFPTADETAALAAGDETDWQEEVYKTGFITNHDIGVSGGTEDTQYSIGAGYFKETTALPGQAFTRYSLRATIDQKIGDRFKVGFNTLNTLNTTDGENVNPMFQLLTLSPLYYAYKPDGSINELPAVGSPDPGTRNPLLLYNKDLWKQQRNRIRTFNSVYGEVKIVEGLKYRINVGLDYSSDSFGQFYGSNTPMINGSVNQVEIRNGTNSSYTLENLLLYEKTFAEKHRVSFTGLFSAQEVETITNQTNAQDVAADYVQYYNLGLANTLVSATGNYGKSGLLSWMGRANYAFNDKYLLTATIRADGTSRLAEGHQWLSYPALALGWNIKNEAFMDNVSVVSNLKLRVGYGKAGNQSTAPYSSLGALSRVPYNFGAAGTYGFLVTSLPNPGLGWESTTTTNIGLDFGLLSNRVSGSIELYQANTDDILQQRNLPVTSGVTSPYVQNIGKTENKGLELTLSGDVIESKKEGGFTWSLDVNYFVNREEITQLADTITMDVNNGWFVGHPMDVIYDYRKLGIWQLGEETAASTAGNFVPGDIKLEDRNANGTLDALDRQILGTLQPKWQGGLTSRFTFMGFDLSVVMYARMGGMLVSTLYQANIGNPINSLEGRRSGPKVDYWTDSNPTNAFPRPGMGQVPFGPGNGSSLGYYDASYMKIRSINLGYSLPTKWMGRTGISSLRVYVTTQNPFKAFFSDYVKLGGLDPETSGRGGTVTPGFGNRLSAQPNTPLTRAIIFGLNIKY